MIHLTNQLSAPELVASRNEKHSIQVLRTRLPLKQGVAHETNSWTTQLGIRGTDYICDLPVQGIWCFNVARKSYKVYALKLNLRHFYWTSMQIETVGLPTRKLHKHLKEICKLIMPGYFRECWTAKHHSQTLHSCRPRCLSRCIMAESH